MRFVISGAAKSPHHTSMQGTGLCSIARSVTIWRMAIYYTSLVCSACEVLPDIFDALDIADALLVGNSGRRLDGAG